MTSRCFTGKHHFLEDLTQCSGCRDSLECANETIKKLYAKIQLYKNAINRKLVLAKKHLLDMETIKHQYGYGELNQRVINETRVEIGLLETIRRETE